MLFDLFRFLSQRLGCLIRWFDVIRAGMPARLLRASDVAFLVLVFRSHFLFRLLLLVLWGLLVVLLLLFLLLIFQSPAVGLLAVRRRNSVLLECWVLGPIRVRTLVVRTELLECRVLGLVRVRTLVGRTWPFGQVGCGLSLLEV